MILITEWTIMVELTIQYLVSIDLISYSFVDIEYERECIALSDGGGYPTGGAYPTGGGFPTGGYGTGYVTTAVVPRQPIGPPLGMSGSSALGGYGLGGLGGGLGGGLPPKIRVIFIPQGGAGGAGG